MIVIAGYPVDASLTETHRFDSEVTDYPVESGSSITDNVRVKPIEVEIEAVTSNTPLAQMKAIRKARNEFNDPATANITALASPPFTSITNDVTPASTTFAALMKIRNDREPVSITTALKVYNNMVMESLSIPMASDKVGGLFFTARFKEVIIVTNERTVVRSAIPAKVHTNAGLARGGANDPIYVVSYPTSERAKHANLGSPVLTDTNPPYGAKVNSFTWDHYRCDPRSQKVDGFCAFTTTIRNGASLTYHRLAPGEGVAYNHGAAGWETQSGRVIQRTPTSFKPNDNEAYNNWKDSTFQTALP